MWTMARSTTARPVTQSRFIGRADPIGHRREGPCFATTLSTSPSTRKISASFTSSSRAALSAIVCSANSALVAELATARSTSAVAFCRASASASSYSRAASCVFSSTVETCLRVALVLAFVPVERSLRPRVWLFAPLRGTTNPHGTSIDPGPPGHLKHITAGSLVYEPRSGGRQPVANRFAGSPMIFRRDRTSPGAYSKGIFMPDVTYEIVQHDGGWAYRVNGVFSETFSTHAEARAAVRAASAEQEILGQSEAIEYEDDRGAWHTETASGRDRPHTVVKDVD